MERMFLETQEQNRQLVEAMRKVAKEGITTNVGFAPPNVEFVTPEKTGRSQIKSHAPMIRGSPVDKETYREDRNSYEVTVMYEYNGDPKWGVPMNEDMMFQLAKFSAKETHKGLGTSVNEWVNRFVRQLERAQIASGCFWPGDVKMDVLENHLEGKALDYWQIKRDSWSGLKLEHAMEALKRNYKCTLSDRQAMVHFD
jgi:hypothetical protein